MIDPGTRDDEKIREGDAPCAPRWEQDPGRDVRFELGDKGASGDTVDVPPPPAQGVASLATSSYIPFHAVGRGTPCGWA